MEDPAGAAQHARETLAKDGTWLIVEPFASDKPEENHNPVGRVFYSASTMLCVPHSLAHDGPALGAQAGEARLRDVVVDEGGFTRFRRATRDAVQPDPRSASLTDAAHAAGRRALTARPAAGDIVETRRMTHARRKTRRSTGGARKARAAVAPAGRERSPKEKLLDAAERLLIEVGHGAVTTRLVSKEAGVNHGLVHYYYGSMEELFLAVLERFTARLIVRQRAMYAADTTFLVKWRKAMGFLEEDLAAGYPKIWLELQAMGWNRPAMRKRDRGRARRVAHGAHRGVRAGDEALRDRGRPARGRSDGRARGDVQPRASCWNDFPDVSQRSRRAAAGRSIAGSRRSRRRERAR